MGIRRTLLSSAVGFAGIAGVAGYAMAAELTISCGSVGQEQSICEQAVEEWSEATGNTVRLFSVPTSTTEQLALYQQILSSGGSDLDIIMIDVIWPGILGNHLLDLAPYSNGVEAEHFQPIVSNNTYQGKLVAMPWYTDAGLLFYRKDLLEKYGADAPKTWGDLTATAKMIQDGERAAGNSKMWGFVYQAKAYEGLTCDALEWIDSFGGGAVVNAQGDITINNEKAAQALTLAASWTGTIAPGGVLSYQEEDARGVFQSGNAVFMRNWPYAWSLGQADDSPVKDKIGVMALPKGGEEGKQTGTLGGWQLAVSKYSESPEIAADLVMYLTSKKEQKRRAIEGSYNPTIAALYTDADILEASPFMGQLKDTFTNAVARPSRATGSNYNKVSNAFYNAVHDVLSGESEASASLAKLERNLKRIKRRGW
ncbi:putative ABC transporter-binding protein precursor [Pseudovibrio axinellae]|uniref:Putative ABC transporter-binding protein n=1 Tax=Pseudovibrio axinellae TaxID=989403 RepID=A0A165XRQ9_9HYPH|nr:ABC transporter substrate-binding protein [Pseudovibrio axinellae]KZL17976.1 putative ABC transporter-binding protein precursor [Pseudovibrio axinellae]SER14740.1 carbohydrate ABC transporter substrate-binding protein, CUT1 family [Pseudovibrio axinellae]